MDERELRGLSIISKGDTPMVVSDEEFVVPSQNGGGRYIVKHHQEWTCICPDHQYGGCECKHIHSIKFWLKMRSRAVDDALDVNELVGAYEEKLLCPKCRSESIVNNGSLGETPAEKAGIDLKLGRNRVYDLMVKSVSPECDKPILSPAE